MARTVIISNFITGKSFPNCDPIKGYYVLHLKHSEKVNHYINPPQANTGLFFSKRVHAFDLPNAPQQDILKVSHSKYPLHQRNERFLVAVFHFTYNNKNDIYPSTHSNINACVQVGVYVYLCM